MTVHDLFPEPNEGHSVRVPGELSETVPLRSVPMTETEMRIVREVGLRLSEIGATTTGNVLLTLAAKWRLAA